MYPMRDVKAAEDDGERPYTLIHNQVNMNWNSASTDHLRFPCFRFKVRHKRDFRICTENTRHRD